MDLNTIKQKFVGTIKVIGWIFLLVTIVIFIWLRMSVGEGSGKEEKEYQTAHGIINGQVNHINIHGINFTIPEDIRVFVSSRGKHKVDNVNHGKADSMTMEINYHQLLDVPASLSGNNVLLQFKYKDKALDRSHYDFSNMADQWEKVIHRPELGLVEYQSKDNTQRPINFQAEVGLMNIPLNERLQFKCATTLDKSEVTACLSIIQYANGMDIWLRIPGRLLPHWQIMFRDLFIRIDNMTGGVLKAPKISPLIEINN